MWIAHRCIPSCRIRVCKENNFPGLLRNSQVPAAKIEHLFIDIAIIQRNVLVLSGEIDQKEFLPHGPCPYKLMIYKLSPTTLSVFPFP